MPKIIVFTGGVYSSVGKGITLSSVGRILQDIGFKISALKLDPYLNLNSGNLSPKQHGEVYVTADGLETDLDLGHYERFMNYELSKYSCITAGKIYSNIVENQKKPNFSGNTVQVIPDLIEEIHKVIHKLIEHEPDSDFLLIEIGGTAGDMESIPFLEAVHHLLRKWGSENIMFIHITPIIFLQTNKEFKTKPAQHSIKQLLSYGIIPNLLVLRAERILSEEFKEKISIASSIDINNILYCIDQKIIYLIPEFLFRERIHEKILSFFNMSMPKSQLETWNKFTNKIKKAKHKKVSVAIVGKYSSVSDSYISISESLKLAAYELDIDLNIDLFKSEDLDKLDFLSLYSCVCVPHGFGEKGVDGKLRTISYCRVNNIPFLGICFGMQLACIEYAQNVLKLNNANTTEIDPNASIPLFIKLPSDYEADMRLGNKGIKIYKNTLAHKLFNTEKIIERHRHKYFFNPKYIPNFKDTDFVISAVSDDALGLVEIIELKNHIFFMGVQFHPEFNTKPLKVSPLFLEFLRSAKEL